MEISCAAKDAITIAKDVTTISAAGGALLFFGYEIIAGWLRLNLTVSIAAERTSVPEQEDHLVVKSLLIQDGQCRTAHPTCSY
jgi:hypothetical protein